MRDVRSEHLPLLEALQARCLREIARRFGVPGSLVRAYLHYQPTFYHLHVHFTPLRHPASAHLVIDKSIFLSDVIQNLRLCGQYYQRATLRYPVRVKTGRKGGKKRLQGKRK